MSHDLASIEVPRHVKKPGQYKRVETHQELADALADGWVLRLDPAQQAPAELPDPNPEQAPDPDAGADEAPKRKPGRPKGDAAKKK